MTKRFVLITSPMTAEEEKRLAAALAPPLGWWHQLPNTWAIVDHASAHDGSYFRGLVQAINHETRCLVVEVRDNNWTLRAPMAQGEWFRDHWEP